MKAYKVFNPDWTCRGFQFEVGKTYSIKGTPVMCENGFHACKNICDCFSYYSFDPNNKVAEVELSGIILGEEQDKQCAQSISILRELSWVEVLSLANIGKGNSGNSNSGNWNSGNWNSGNRNSGYSNSGDSNSGNSNSGNWNSGYRNSGYRNSGYSNSGNSNSGYSNSGNWNSGNWNSGCFNSITPTDILVFNKKCKKEKWDKIEKPDFIYNIILNEWVSWGEMSEKEKMEDRDAFIRGGYLKSYSYKEAWQRAFNNVDKDTDIPRLKALPNFDSKVFFEITGIKID